MKVGDWYYENDKKGKQAVEITEISESSNTLDVLVYYPGYKPNKTVTFLHAVVGELENGFAKYMTEAEIAKVLLARS